jgi:hypothetical protein
MWVPNLLTTMQYRCRVSDPVWPTRKSSPCDLKTTFIASTRPAVSSCLRIQISSPVKTHQLCLWTDASCLLSTFRSRIISPGSTVSPRKTSLIRKKYCPRTRIRMILPLPDHFTYPTTRTFRRINQNKAVAVFFSRIDSPKLFSRSRSRSRSILIVLTLDPEAHHRMAP